MSTQKKALIPVTLIPGDGIGPEIMESAVEVLAALGAPFEWDKQFAGLAGFEAKGDPLPEETLASIRRTRLALPRPGRQRSGTLGKIPCSALKLVLLVVQVLSY